MRPFRLSFVCLAIALVVPTSASAAPVTPKSAAGFRDSVGVNTHIVYFDTAYSDWSRVVQRLDEIGIDHLRDAAFGNTTPQWHDWNERYFSDVLLAAAHGKRFDFLMGYPGYNGGSIDDLINVLTGRLRGTADALEAPNEFDNAGKADWAAQLRPYVQTIHDRVKSDPALSSLPFIGPSLVFGARSWGQLGRMDGLVDFGNMHPYAGGQTPTRDHVAQEQATAALGTGSTPTWATEAGFHNAMAATTGQPAVPEDVAAVYTLRTLLEHYDAGVARTYLYELLDEKPNPANDDPEQHFGLLRNDLSLKPAAVALQNLLRVIGHPADPGPRAPVDVSLAGDTAGVREMLLQEGTGHYRLVLWQTGSLWDTNRKARLSLPTRRVQVTLPTAAVTAYEPVVSATGQALTPVAGQFRVDLGEGPIVLDFGGSPMSSAAPALAATAAGCGCPVAPAVTAIRPIGPVGPGRNATVATASTRVTVRLCPHAKAKLLAAIGVQRKPRGRFHKLAAAQAAITSRCRVSVTVPPLAARASAGPAPRLVLRLSYRPVGRKRRSTVYLRLGASKTTAASRRVRPAARGHG